MNYCSWHFVSCYELRSMSRLVSLSCPDDAMYMSRDWYMDTATTTLRIDVGRMVQSCSIASLWVGRPINCDITERAFGICRPEISTRALVNVTEGGGHYPTTMILLGFLTSGLRLPYNLCFPSSSHRQSLLEGFYSQWIYRSNRSRRREEEVILHIRPHKYW